MWSPSVVLGVATEAMHLLLQSRSLNWEEVFEGAEHCADKDSWLFLNSSDQ